VDASDRSRAGIRITLCQAAALARAARLAVDCAGGLADDTPLRHLDYVVVDVETTGGSFTRGHRITEFAAVRLSGDGRIVDEYRSLVNPERPIPPVISAITNISWDMVRSAPRFAEVAHDVANVLRGAVFVAHNAGFDWRFVAAELERAGIPAGGRTLCTVQLARKVVPEVRSRSLDSLSYFFNIPNAARHRAWGDAEATVELFRRLMDRLETLDVARWAELQRLLQQRARRRKRRSNPHCAPEDLR
jgi:DNA polymerase III subunit epsilon